MSKFHNPIYEKDRWAANRSKAFLIAVLAVNSVIAVIAIVVFVNMVSYMKTSIENDYAALLQLYLTLAMAECLMIVFIAPALAGTGISQERENGNLELFLSTGVSPWQVILGKLVSCMNMMLVLIVTSLPVFSLVFVYGGVQMRDLIAMISVLLIVALEICSLSILCSACANRSVYAALSAYASNLILIGGTLFVHLAPSLLYSSSVYGDQLGSPVSWYHYLLLTNPVVTFYGVLNYQAGSRSAIFDMINYMGNYKPNWITQHWLPVSLLVQAAIVAFELLYAVHILYSKRRGNYREIRLR